MKMNSYSVYYVTKICRRAIVTASSKEEAEYKFYDDNDCEYVDDYCEPDYDYCEVVEVVLEEGEEDE